MLLAYLLSLAGVASAATYTQQALEGPWSGAWLTTGTLNFTVDATGHFTGTGVVGASVPIVGQLSLISPSGHVTGTIDFAHGGAVFTLDLTLTSPGTGGRPNRLMGSAMLPGQIDPTDNAMDVSGGTDASGAPSAATAAAATPNPVTGTTTNLSVLGASTFGEAALTYTWSVPLGAVAPVSFSANGTNTSKITTATFQAAGTYTFTVVIRDARGIWTQSSVDVPVLRQVTGMTVVTGGSVLEGAAAIFRASGVDQFGAQTSAVPVTEWTVSGGGTISSNGIFSATQAGGPFTVTARSGTLTASASFTVTANTPPAFASEPTASPNPATPGATISFFAAASDADGQALSYAWDFGDGAVLSGSSVTHAYTLPGAYTATVTVRDGAASTARTLDIAVLPPPGRLFLGQLKARLSFARPGRDTLTLKASAGPLGAGFQPAGQHAELNVGGAVSAFELDARGKGRSAGGRIALKLRHGSWTLQAGLKGAFAAAWAGLGLVNADITSSSVSLPVSLNLAGALYTGERPLTYSAKKDTKGQAK